MIMIMIFADLMNHVLYVDAFDLVLEHHNDCRYPASITKYNGGAAERSVVQELFQ